MLWNREFAWNEIKTISSLQSFLKLSYFAYLSIARTVIPLCACHGRSSPPFDPRRRLNSAPLPPATPFNGEKLGWIPKIHLDTRFHSKQSRSISLACLKRLSLAPDAPDSIHLHLGEFIYSLVTIRSNSIRR